MPRLALQSFELWVALAAVITCIVYFFAPSTFASAAVAAAVPRLATIWSVLYGLGGLLTVFGLVRICPRIEAAGLCLLASGVIVAGIALIYVRGLTFSTLPSGLIQMGVAASCATRVWVLMKVGQ